MTAVMLLIVGLAIGWWGNKARFWVGEVTSTVAKVSRYRKERNRSMAMTALFLTVLVILIIGFTQGEMIPAQPPIPAPLNVRLRAGNHRVPRGESMWSAWMLLRRTEHVAALQARA
jgi:hypothetical protein